MLEKFKKDESELYESGKHRRYGLLFAVNGGAFAVAKLLTGEPGKAGVVLGALTLPELAIGMTLFTILMVVDIYFFGLKMKKRLPDDFGPIGKLVLISIGALLCAGWLLAGFGK